ncbi:MAG: penicillin-binding protein activator [Cellvibrio sp.]|nr:penicillin-binding protein activator [Cellvibrio sp.]
MTNWGNTQASVSERIKLAVLLTDKKAEELNQQSLWRSLMKMNFSELQHQSEIQSGDAEKGWYSLAAIAKNHQIDLETQRELLQDWTRDWRRHPARNNLPSELKLIQNLLLNQPKKIALLLPQSGKLTEAGEALRDGFFAAYYQALNAGRQVPEVIQFDSSGDIIQQYQQAVDQGAELIIGPVEKEKVAELNLMPSMSVPLLALNYAESNDERPLNYFYQFGLAVEDEARQVARQAFTEGKRQAMLIIPQQEWSQRAATAFTQEWESLGGLVVNRTQFFPNMNFSNLVKDVMLIESSQIRTRQLENFLGMQLESAPRSRSDVDMIFLIADPVQARQIKPMFAFHYAGDIPIYATSQIYSGTPNPKADRDLNGVRFNTMPWLFDSQSAEKTAIAQETNSAAVYGRLHALGVDAYRLYARLPQMAKAPDMRINGATGSLRLLSNGRIEREQLWARFIEGNALALPMVVEDENE